MIYDFPIVSGKKLRGLAHDSVRIQVQMEVGLLKKCKVEWL